MRLLRPLRRPATALLWGGLATSSIGDQVYIVAIAWIGVLAFGPHAGWLNAFGSACTLVTVLFSGPWVDRFRPASAMVVADGARAAVLLPVVAAWSAGMPLPVWAALLVVAVAVLGIGQGVFRPALQAVLPATVDDPALLPAANALFDSTERIARLLGPGIIGVLSAALSPIWFLLIDAGTFVVSAWCVRRAGGSGTVVPAVRMRVGQALLRGYRANRGHRLLGWQLLSGAPNNGVWMATFYLAVPLLVERHGLTLGGPGDGGFGAYGLVLLGYGCTNLIGNLVVGNRDMPRRPARQVAIGYACMGLGVGGYALLETVELSPGVRLGAYMACAAISAVSGPLQDIPIGVLRQTALPRADVPAAMRASMASGQAGILAALLLAPVVIEAASPGVFLTGCCVTMAVIAIVTATRD